MLQQVLTASIFGFFTAGFFLIWLNNRIFPSAGVFALSYGFAGAAFGFEALYSLVSGYDFIMPVSDTLYMLSALFLSIGLSFRFNQKPPLLFLSLIFAATFFPTQWYWFVENDFTLRTEIISYGCAGMIALGAINIYDRINSLLDRALYYATIGFSVQFVFITVLTLRINKEALNLSNFVDSMYLELLHFSVAIFAIAVAVLLFTSLAVNVIEELQRTSDRDSLTKVHNRSSFENHAINAVEKHLMNGQQLALIVCDIDHFKKANDLNGHSYGDKILLSFVASLKECRRDIDIIGRIGGDQFTILLPKANVEMARLMAEYARTKFDQEHTLDNGKKINLTASFGVTQLVGKDTYRSFFERADKMLYKAKNSGRNKVLTHST